MVFSLKKMAKEGCCSAALRKMQCSGVGGLLLTVFFCRWATPLLALCIVAGAAVLRCFHAQEGPGGAEQFLKAGGHCICSRFALRPYFLFGRNFLQKVTGLKLRGPGDRLYPLFLSAVPRLGTTGRPVAPPRRQRSQHQQQIRKKG